MERGFAYACAWALVAALATAQDPRNGEARVAGLVQRDDGGSLQGCRVSITGLAHPELPPNLAWALGAEAELALRGVTDARGLFKVAVPHPGPFALIAVSGDGKRSAYRFPVMAGDFVTVSLRAPSVVGGTVLDPAGRPAAGASVSSTSYSDPGTTRERYASWFPRAVAIADAEGRFHIELPVTEPDGLSFARSLRASSPRLIAAERLYRIDGQSLRDVVLRLDRARQIEGRIATSDGRPLAGAALCDVEESRRVAHTGADGRFAFDNQHGHAWVVRAPGHAIQAFLARDGVCALQPGAVVRARLLTASGPAAGRRVLWATRDSQEIGFHFAWLTATGAEGQIETSEARAGEPLYGFVELEGRFVAFCQVTPVAKPTELGDIQMDATRSVSGTVLAHDGLRRAGAMVALQPVLEVGPRSPPGNSTLPAVLTRVTYTDRAGRFRFDGVPRAPQRCAIAAGLEGLRVLRLNAGQDVGTVQLEQTDQASGTVRLPDGAPAADAALQYVPILEGEDALLGSIHLLGRTDGEGRFVIRGLPAHATFSLWAMCTRDGAGFIVSHSESAAQNDGLELVLQPHSGRL